MGVLFVALLLLLLLPDVLAKKSHVGMAFLKWLLLISTIAKCSSYCSWEASKSTIAISQTDICSYLRGDIYQLLQPKLFACLDCYSDIFYSPDYKWIPGVDPGPDEVEGTKVVCRTCYNLVVDDMIRKQNERLKRRRSRREKKWKYPLTSGTSKEAIEVWFMCLKLSTKLEAPCQHATYYKPWTTGVLMVIAW